MNENKRKFIAGLVSGLIVFGALTFYAIETRAVNPSIVYAYPSNGATFVSVWRGHGVNVTVNVSDGDGDLEQIILKWNNSGTWTTFYDSGALGGVSYHNVTVLNDNFTGSWVTYKYQICAKDGVGWTNTTYSFTTEYVWGDIHCIAYDNLYSLLYPTILKNNTNDYFLAWVNWDDYSVEAIHKDHLLFVNPTVVVEDDTRSADNNLNKFAYLYNYNGKCYIAYTDERYESGGWKRAYYTKYWNGTAWVGKTYKGIYYRYDTSTSGISIKYYNGEWNTIWTKSGSTSGNLYWMNGSAPFNGVSTLIDSDSNLNYEFFPTIEILNGYLVLVYRDSDNDLHWQVYDGVAWTDKGTIELDIGSYGCSVVKDPVNNQLVLVYVNASKNMYYRILTDPNGAWSEPHLLFTPESGKTVKHPYAQYIDHRVVVVFSYNLRGTYDIYMISAPEYLSSASGGVLKQYNRIQFPDATPNQKNVNSSVFYFENINSRAINWINWSFSDIGSIQCENNIRLWGSTDNSSWTLIGTTDANGYINMTTTTWAGGLPWQAGEKRYFKLEILDIGNVPEDLHSVDEGIILKVGLA